MRLPGARAGRAIMLRVCVIRGVMWVMIKYADTDTRPRVSTQHKTFNDQIREREQRLLCNDLSRHTKHWPGSNIKPGLFDKPTDKLIMAHNRPLLSSVIGNCVGPGGENLGPCQVRLSPGCTIKARSHSGTPSDIFLEVSLKPQKHKTIA